MKFFQKNKFLKRTLLSLSLILVMAGGVFVYKALASATITPASGGTAVSIDTTSSEGGSHTGTALGSIIIQEGSVGDIALGIHTLTAPDGWNFTNDNVDIAVAGATELTVANDTINSADGKTLSFNISATSTTGVATLTFTGIKVHPTGETPITGNITLTSGTITGVDGSTNFGTLTSIPGVVTKLAVTTQPTDTIYGSSISDIVIKTQDQFGNNSTSSLGASKTVNVSLSSGTGSLSGTTSGDIGTNDGNGILTFSDLKINAVGTGDKLTFAAESLTSAVSDAFDITAKSLTVTGATVTAKTYDGTKNATISGATLSGVEAGDTVTLGNATTGTFSDADAATGISVGTAPMTISGDDAGNYTLTQPTLTGDINKVQLTIAAPTITKSKIYDGATTAEVTAGALTGVVEGEDVDVSAAADYDSENVGTSKTITVVYTLTGANIINYLAPTDDTANDGAITSKQLTIADPTLTTTKVYDKTTTAEVTAGALTGVVDGDVVTVSVAADYDSENVGTGKTITIVYTLGGTDAGNYTKPDNGTDATGVITAKSVNVTAQTDTKVYNGNNTSSVLPVGDTLIAGDIYTSVGTQIFANANAGAGKTITPAGAVINDGNSGNNYSITYVTTTGTITKANPTITWSNPADITAGTALSNTQLNATATGVGGGSLEGGFDYDPATGTQLTVAGSQELSVEFTPTDTTNYNTVSATTSLNVIPAAAAKINLSASPTSLAKGSNTTLTVIIQDAYGNTITSDDTSTILLYTNGDRAILASSSLQVVDGVKTTTLTSLSIGTVEITASRDTGGLNSGRAIVTFNSDDEVSPIISGVSATSTQTTASITFQSNENGPGVVSFNDSDGIISVVYPEMTVDTSKTLTFSGLTCNTLYNYSIDVKDGNNNKATQVTGTIATLSCTAPEEPSAVLTINPSLTHTGETSGLWSEDGGYGDAYEWVFAITLPNDEAFFALQFEDWTNGLNIDDNMRYWSEEITTGVGSSANPVIINEADTYPDFIEITSDNSPWSVDGGQAGIQTNIHVQLQIPSSTPAGSHSTNFKVRSEASIPS